MHDTYSYRGSHVIVYDGVQSVSKLYSYGLLNEVISLQVHGSCGLVQYQDLGLTGGVLMPDTPADAGQH